MIDKREILEAASALGLLPNVVEKDYVLGWLLAGIKVHPELTDSSGARRRLATLVEVPTGVSKLQVAPALHF